VGLRADIYNDDESAVILDSEKVSAGGGRRQGHLPGQGRARAEDKDIDWLASNKLGIGFGCPPPSRPGRRSTNSSSTWRRCRPAQGWLSSASFDGWQIAKATKSPEVAWAYVLFAVGPRKT